MSAVLSALNKGEAVTSGLKKVTDDMKSKNRRARKPCPTLSFNYTCSASLATRSPPPSREWLRAIESRLPTSTGVSPDPLERGSGLDSPHQTKRQMLSLLSFPVLSLRLRPAALGVKQG
jgi:hypothetical protein